jgi:hypothetical protein
MRYPRRHTHHLTRVNTPRVAHSIIHSTAVTCMISTTALPGCSNTALARLEVCADTNTPVSRMVASWSVEQQQPQQQQRQ